MTCLPLVLILTNLLGQFYRASTKHIFRQHYLITLFIIYETGENLYLLLSLRMSRVREASDGTHVNPIIPVSLPTR